MKQSFKKIVYFFSKFVTPRTGNLSDFFIQLGYALKSEKMYYTLPVVEYKERMVMHEELARAIGKNSEILFLEFGVFFGDTFRAWVGWNQNQKSKFVGFDSFEGLPESWGRWKKGSFSTGGKIPEIDDERSRFIVGHIENTLPNHSELLQSGMRKVIHIDVDIYSASFFTLLHLGPFLHRGEIIIFDDFFTLAVAQHEFKVFLDFQKVNPVKYQPLGKCRTGHFVIEIA